MSIEKKKKIVEILENRMYKKSAKFEHETRLETIEAYKDKAKLAVDFLNNFYEAKYGHEYSSCYLDRWDYNTKGFEIIYNASSGGAIAIAINERLNNLMNAYYINSLNLKIGELLDGVLEEKKR